MIALVKRGSRSIPIFLAVVIVALLSAGLWWWQQENSMKLKLSNGATMQFVGLSHGTRTPPSSVRENILVDMDGDTWLHSHATRWVGWKQRVYEWSPPFLRSRLPASWEPARAGNFQMICPVAMRWLLSGPFDRENWRITWVDENGFESEGYMDRFRFGKGDEVELSGALPPPYSRNVILRVRQYVHGKPLHEWPLQGEMRMKNPCMLTPPATPVMKLPAILTQDGVTLTMQSLVPNTQTGGTGQAKALFTMVNPPGPNPRRWAAVMQVFDARRQGVMGLSRSSLPTAKSEIRAESVNCLWSNGPWFVRVKLHLLEGSLPPAHQMLRFEKVPFPEEGNTFRTIDGKSGYIGKVPVVLMHVEKDGDKWKLAFTRPHLPDGVRFRLISVTDDLGKRMTLAWPGLKIDSSPTLINTFSLKAEGDRAPSFADVVVAIEPPLVFDFHVQPEFPPQRK